MAFDKSTYDKEYAKEHITRKFIAFNDQNPEDKELLEYISTIPNFSKYVKGLIRGERTWYEGLKTPDSLSNRLSE